MPEPNHPGKHGLRWVVEGFLPDYADRLSAFLDRDPAAHPFRDLGGRVYQFQRRHFPEALENLLLHQRIKCVEALGAGPPGLAGDIASGIPSPEPINTI